MLPAFVEVLHHYPHKHVEDKEADNEEERDEVEEHPGVIVGHWLEEKEEKVIIVCLEIRGGILKTRKVTHWDLLRARNGTKITRETNQRL